MATVCFSCKTISGALNPAPESVRAQAWSAGGLASIFDVNLHKVYEMGKGSTRQFNDIFDTAAGSTTYPAAHDVLMVKARHPALGARGRYLQPHQRDI
jgi:hypothetical protein